VAVTKAKRVRIGELLVGSGCITDAQLGAALAEQKTSNLRLGEQVVKLGFVTEQQLFEILGQHFGVPCINLKQYPFTPEAARALPEIPARRHNAVLLGKDSDGAPLVGMVDPGDLHAYDQLAQALKRPFRAALVNARDVALAHDLIYRRTEEISTLAGTLREELAGGDAAAARPTVAGDTAVDRLLQSLFRDAVQVQASDIHIEPEERLLRIRQRVDGVLQETILEQGRISSALVTRLKLMAGLDISEKRMPQDGRFNMIVGGRTLNVRLSTLPVQFGEGVVMRLLDQESKLLGLAELGMAGEVHERFRQIIRRRHGLVLVTGPTGSGKTTTLYAALSEINSEDQKIITVEDPVEYRLPRISQVQVQHRIGLDFARVLRSALRQDPDIIMIGEMRDRETQEIALRAAMTGHLVFSTLHTNNALSSVDRLIDMGAEGYLVAASLISVLSQQLVRRVCSACAVQDPLDDRQRGWLRAVVPAGGERPAYRCGGGCVRCHGTGYRGRVGLYELLTMDAPMADALRRMDLAAFADAARVQTGYRPLLAAGLDYAAAGVTTVHEVMRVAEEIKHGGGMAETR
jgi:MSHA biogenesis protein MshE